MMCSAMTNHLEDHLTRVKAELKIAEGEEPLWDAYAAAARDSANAMQAHCINMMGEHSGTMESLPDRSDRNEQLMAAHLDAMRAMDKALKLLYAALDDSQKRTADRLFLGPMGLM